MDVSDYTAELDEIRHSYIRSYPRQRLHIIKQRLAGLEDGPNRLTVAVSAVEAFARSIALHAVVTDRDNIPSVYPKYRDRDPKSLVGECVERYGLGPSPPAAFGDNVWALFGLAVSFRNLLVHECTYLGQDKYPKLTAACITVLEKLAVGVGLDGQLQPRVGVER